MRYLLRDFGRKPTQLCLKCSFFVHYLFTFSLLFWLKLILCKVDFHFAFNWWLELIWFDKSQVRVRYFMQPLTICKIRMWMYMPSHEFTQRKLLNMIDKKIWKFLRKILHFGLFSLDSCLYNRVLDDTVLHIMLCNVIYIKHESWFQTHISIPYLHRSIG